MISALLLIDLQKDFMPGGSLPVPHGDEVVMLANELQSYFRVVVATKDWHPDNHSSFALNHPTRQPFDIVNLDGFAQTLWPKHCVQHTQGAEFIPTLNTDRINKIILKGIDPAVDSYSGFFDNGYRKSTGLTDYLKAECVDTVYIIGVATDYCVKYTALDARKCDLQTYLVVDACRGVNLQPDDVKNALTEMEAVGVQMITSTLLKEKGFIM